MSVDELIERVEDLLPGELIPVLDAVMERYRVLFPEWEIIYAAIPKKVSPERTAFLQELQERLQEHM